MKTVKRFVFVLATLVIVCAACNPDDNEIGQVTPYTTEFHLVAAVADFPLDFENDRSLELAANSKCNLSESIIVEIESDLRKLNQEQDTFEVRQGEINFFDPEESCSLSGEFEGKGFEDDGSVTIEAIIVLEYGTGKLRANGGELLLTISGTLTQDRLMDYQIEIEGYLER